MAGNVNLWSTTANTNQSVDPDINFAEGQLPGTLNDSCRGVMAGIAGDLKDTTAQVTTGGSGSAMTFASNIPGLTYLQGLEIVFKAGFTNTGACTINVTPSGGAALGTKAIRMMAPGGEIDPPAGVILLNGHYRIVYDTAANNAAGAFILQASQPQLTPSGRLTLTSGTPVLIANATAQSTVYYTPYLGGSFAELSCVLDTSNFLSTKLYDFFLVMSAGSVALGYGPAWTNTTTRSGAISRFGGLWTNTSTMTVRLSSSTTVSAAANSAIYVGTCYGTANGQTGMNILPTAASGGTANILGVFNAYNRIAIQAVCRDSAATWTYGTATWRAADNNANNSISFIDGLGEVSIGAIYSIIGNAPVAAGAIGVNLNSTTATPSVTGHSGNAANTNLTAPYIGLPVLGYNTLTAMEWANSGNFTFFGGPAVAGAGQSMAFQVTVSI